MAKFAYHITKNASTGHMLFKRNCGFYSQAFNKKDINPYSQSKLANKLAIELREQMAACKKNLQHA